MKTFSQANQPLAANESKPAAKAPEAPRPDRPLPAPAAAAPELVRRPHMLVAVLLALVASVFWVGIGAAFLSGYVGPDHLLALPLQQAAPIMAALLLPPLLFIAIGLLIVWAIGASSFSRWRNRHG